MMATHVNLLDYAPGFLIRILDYAVTPWENLDGLARPLWHDLSSYQGKANLDVLVMSGCQGFAFRSGISWGYQDAFFPMNWGQSDPLDTYRTSYHVIYTDQSIESQLDNWYRVHPEPDPRRPIPRVIDLEVNRPDPAAHKAESVWKMMELVESRDGMKPWIYSRYLLINQWLSPFWTADMLNSVYWWLAQYLTDRIREHPGDPTLPNGVDRDRVLLHQTADKKAPPAGAVESYALDYNRWERGTEAQMVDFLGAEYGSGEAPKTLEERVERLEKAVFG